MNSLDRLMEILAASVFLLVGLNKLLSHKRRPKSLGAAECLIFPRFPYWCVAAVGLFEMAAAVALISPSNLALFACAMLGGTSAAACLFRQSRNESPAPTFALLMLTVFIVCGRCF